MPRPNMPIHIIFPRHPLPTPRNRAHERQRRVLIGQRTLVFLSLLMPCKVLGEVLAPANDGAAGFACVTVFVCFGVEVQIALARESSFAF
ncbi:hypothetical protein BU26DRAFT_515281 [Trematosphaeria pertusa]|uniref:Uncharacterized protein n=1 Tax=Trematosphaeria pertusa TaxID=390896 RepID=A0A6A6IQL5_9PLEO|nr:uncharacterized protein BU26DRAFT_515281 [Trematosphaeria pertusa]KAF2252844.1 hypothetical protein BU26DRAFT_515281 [Trematosphaeria pertusa]